MVTPIDPRLRELQESTAAIMGAILTRRRMNPADLARATEARGGATKKTVYNALRQANPPTLPKLVDYAEALQVPVWALLLDGLQHHPELLDPGALDPLVGVIENYLKTHPDKRIKIERMAQAMCDETAIEK